MMSDQEYTKYLISINKRVAQEQQIGKLVLIGYITLILLSIFFFPMFIIEAVSMFLVWLSLYKRDIYINICLLGVTVATFLYSVITNAFLSLTDFLQILIGEYLFFYICGLGYLVVIYFLGCIGICILNMFFGNDYIILFGIGALSIYTTLTILPITSYWFAYCVLQFFIIFAVGFGVIFSSINVGNFIIDKIISANTPLDIRI